MIYGEIHMTSSLSYIARLNFASQTFSYIYVSPIEKFIPYSLTSYGNLRKKKKTILLFSQQSWKYFSIRLLTNY